MLDLSNNQLKEIPPNINELINLSVLNISGNKGKNYYFNIYNCYFNSYFTYFNFIFQMLQNYLHKWVFYQGYGI